MRLRWTAVSLCALVLVGGALAQSGFGQPRQDGPAAGQRGQGFGRMMGGGMMAGMLLQRPDVQRELNLTEQQKAQIRQMQENQRTAMQELRNLPPEERRQKMQELRQKNDPTSVLNETQKKRLREIELQAMGAFALMQPDVADALNLTQEQRSKLQGIVMQSMQQLREQFQNGGQGQGAQNWQQMRDQMEKQMLEVLTPAQRQQWQQMQGKPFQFEGGRPMPWGGGRGGFGGGPRGGSGFGGGRGFGN
ncbi:MAG: hypothetical protein NZ556_07585 [Fimbriimonadales bacterium]|nr:hypothetical protein [Fimbriimonadales bacterium]